MRALVLTIAIAVLPGCLEDDLQATIYYNFELLDPAPDNHHYQQFGQINGGVADLGCFVVEMRQLTCDDRTTDGDPRIRPVVVECNACPCIDRSLNPCDDSELVTRGEPRGTVDHPDGLLRTGGVEIPTRVELGTATELFITIEPNFDDEPGPSGDVILRGDATRDGAVLRGTLENPAGGLVNGLFTIVPMEDEVTL